MATVTKGTAHIHSISGTITGLTIQSYTVSKSFANSDEVTNASGVVIGVKMYDERTTLQVEGLVPTSYSAAIGDALSFTGNGIAFSGFIQSIEERGEAKGYMRISVSAIDYEGIA
jgi:hypothetical protein